LNVDARIVPMECAPAARIHAAFIILRISY
jgi:hypothetical protein